MNASATIRASYVRASVFYAQPHPTRPIPPVPTLKPRPAQVDKLQNFKPVDHLQHREDCKNERLQALQALEESPYNPPETNPDSDLEKNNNVITASSSFMNLDDEKETTYQKETFAQRLKKMFTILPLRDPIWLVAIVFAIGSIILVINAFFELKHAIPSAEHEIELEHKAPSSHSMPSQHAAPSQHTVSPPTHHEDRRSEESAPESLDIPVTLLISSILFFIAGIFDTFGALNADRGTLEKSQEDFKIHYKPALLGTPEFKWIPSRVKFMSLLTTNLAFQAGLVVTVGGIFFMVAGIVSFPGVVDEKSGSFELIVFGPHCVHGALFFIANALLALADQERWFKPKVQDAEWQGAALNALGGLGLMMAGIFFYEEDDLVGSIAALIGSWSFLIGSLIRWYAVMEVY